MKSRGVGTCGGSKEGGEKTPKDVSEENGGSEEAYLDMEVWSVVR